MEELSLLLLLLLSLSRPTAAQQAYINNAQDDCYGTNGSTTLGYTCNAGDAASCATYLTLRAQPPYNSPALLSFILNTPASNITSTNNLTSDVAPVAAGDLLLVPTSCSCSAATRHYQHTASFTISPAANTYLIVANDTYGGLTTCQALIAQNPYNDRGLLPGNNLTVPIRCACPSQSQSRSGAKYLLTYLVTWGDDVPTIAARFGADYQSVLDANGLTAKSIIYPFTTLLIPLKTEPTVENVAATPSPPPPPPPPTDSGGGGSSSSKKWVFVGIAIGAALLIISAIPLCLCFHRRRRRRHQNPAFTPAPPSKLVVEPSSEYQPFTSEIRKALESLAVYKFSELERATGSFDEEHRVKGSSVFRAIINGDAAAVKILKGDISDEISILRQINHSSVVRLSGFCIHEGNTYLVYEFAERGSLADLLHRKDDNDDDAEHLSWKQRVQIAYDVADGLNYLHHYANPPYVHKDLKSSNVLLDGDLRAKVGNFGLARKVGEQEGMHITAHVVGTQGYMAPEYLEHGLITPKLDVFAFGVVMLELLSGKGALLREGDGKGEMLLSAKIGEVLSGEDVRSKLREFVDPSLGDDYPFELAFAVAELAMRCVVPEPASRPTMAEVLVSLSAIYNSSLDWDPSEAGNSVSLPLGR